MPTTNTRSVTGATRRSLPLAPVAEAAEGAACTLPPADLPRRRRELGDVLSLAVRLAESARGFVITFPATDAAARAVCEAVLAERLCCAQFRYVIRFAPGAETFSLTVDARGRHVAPLKALYAPLLAEIGRDG